MRWRTLWTPAALLAVACSAGAAANAAGEATRPLLGSDHSGTIFSVQAGGAGFTRLFPCGLGSPVLAPDGRTYLAVGIERRARLTYGRIFRLPLAEPVETRCDTAHNERLPSADTGLEGWAPRFSPNGRKLLLVDPTTQRVATASANGLGKRVFGPAGALAAGWSPDGRKIAVARQAFHEECPTGRGKPPSSNPYCWTGELLVMNANGSGARSIYLVPKDKPLRQYVRITSVDWSRNGRILFTTSAGGSGGASRLAVVNTDGSGFRAVTKWPQRALNGVWSPSGTQIAFTVRGGGGVFVATPTGGRPRNVTKTWATNGLDW